MKNRRTRHQPINEIIIIPLLAWLLWLALFIPMMICLYMEGWDGRLPGKRDLIVAEIFWPVLCLSFFPLVFTWAFTRKAKAKNYQAHAVNMENRENN